MSNRYTGPCRAALAALACAVAAAAFAQEDPPPDPTPLTREEMMKLVDGALPPQIGGENSTLVERLMRARLGPQLSQTFDLQTALRAVFGSATPRFGPGCNTRTTPAGEADPGDCTAYIGNEAGRGAYSRLSFSKNMGFGNINFLRRPADMEITPADLKPVQLSDREVFDRGVGMLVSAFGLPREEIPTPPRTAVNPYPVRTLALGWADETGKGGRVGIRKSLFLQRGVFVGIPGGGGIPGIAWVPAPGRAIVTMDDSGVWQAKIRSWQELRAHPGVDPRQAKTRSALLEEITDDLLRHSDEPVATMKAQIQMTAIPSGQIGLLLPAVRVSVSPVPPGTTEEDQPKVGQSTAGYAREYLLVSLPETRIDEE